MGSNFCAGCRNVFGNLQSFISNNGVVQNKCKNTVFNLRTRVLSNRGSAMIDTMLGMILLFSILGTGVAAIEATKASDQFSLVKTYATDRMTWRGKLTDDDITEIQAYALAKDITLSSIKVFDVTNNDITGDSATAIKLNRYNPEDSMIRLEIEGTNPKLSTLAKFLLGANSFKSTTDKVMSVYVD